MIVREQMAIVSVRSFFKLNFDWRFKILEGWEASKVFIVLAKFCSLKTFFDGNQIAQRAFCDGLWKKTFFIENVLAKLN